MRSQMSYFGLAGLVVLALLVKTTHNVIRDQMPPPGGPVVQMFLHVVGIIVVPAVIMLAGALMWQGVAEVYTFYRTAVVWK